MFVYGNWSVVHMTDSDSLTHQNHLVIYPFIPSLSLSNTFSSSLGCSYRLFMSGIYLFRSYVLCMSKNRDKHLNRLYSVFVNVDSSASLARLMPFYRFISFRFVPFHYVLKKYININKLKYKNNNNHHNTQWGIKNLLLINQLMCIRLLAVFQVKNPWNTCNSYQLVLSFHNMIFCFLQNILISRNGLAGAVQREDWY